MTELVTSATPSQSHKTRSGLARLISGWKAALKVGRKSAFDSRQRIVNPYPGLRSFDPAESAFYFGRAGQDVALAERLKSHNVVGVLGGSGSGKSSLVLAGLLPYLKQFRRIPGREGRWYVASMRPGLDPIGSLVDALWNSICAPLADTESGLRALVENFSSLGVPAIHNKKQFLTACKEALAGFLVPESGNLSSESLKHFGNTQLNVLDSTAWGVQVGPPNLLLVIDQFEELFRKEVPAKDANSIFELIKYIHEIPRQGLFITFTMRSEELHRCAEYEGLSEVVFGTSMQIELLTKDSDLRSAIIEPARRAFDSWGIPYDGSASSSSPVEAELVNDLVKETRLLSQTLPHRPDSLPLLQHALRSIWATAVSRWHRESKANGGTVTRPQIAREDFLWLGTNQPFKDCLNNCANAALDQALSHTRKKLSDYSKPVAVDAADNLINMALVTLARLDDNNRWVRRFAADEEIANSAIVDITDPESGQKKRLKDLPSGLKRGLVNQALSDFCREGYLVVRERTSDREGSSSDKIYDVSHEALIRSWSHYQRLLGEARLTRDALFKADDELQRKGGKPKPSWMVSVVRWVRGGNSRHAWETLQRVNMKDLERVYLSPRWLGATWAEALFSEERRREARAEVGDAAGLTNLSSELAKLTPLQRLRRIGNEFRLARKWKEWSGRWPPYEHQRVIGISVSVVLLAGFVGILSWSNVAAVRLQTVLQRVAALSDDVVRIHPVEARNQLAPAFVYAKDIPLSGPTSWIPRLMGATDNIYSALQILDQKSRAVLRFLPGRVGNDQEVNRYLEDVSCGKVTQEDAAIVSVAGQALKFRKSAKGIPLGYSFTAPKGEDPPGSRPDEQYLRPDITDAILCVAVKDPALLMQIQATNVVLYPLTLLTKVDGSTVIQLGTSSPVIFYKADSNNFSPEFNEQAAIHIASVAQKHQELRSFRYKKDGTELQGFAVRYSQNQYIYITNIAAANQPVVINKDQCRYYKFENCNLGRVKSFATNDFLNIPIDEQVFYLRVKIDKPGDDPKCDRDEICPQRLLLRPGSPAKPAQGTSLKDGDQGNPTVTRMELAYVGLPILEAKASPKTGYIVLLDSAGNILEFMVSSNIFHKAIVYDAGRLVFQNNQVVTPSNSPQQTSVVQRGPNG